MKKHYYALGAALLAGGVLVSGFGAVLKQQLPEDLAFLYEEHSVIALPFALLADGNLRGALTFDFEGQDGTLPAAETVRLRIGMVVVKLPNCSSELCT